MYVFLVSYISNNILHVYLSIYCQIINFKRSSVFLYLEHP